MRGVWDIAARKISEAMRKDTVNIYVSDPIQNDLAEEMDSLKYLCTCKANVTTPPEYIDEEEQGTVRTHYYDVSIDADVSLPQDKKIFIELVESRQGIQGAILEVSQISGGLLGQTLSAADEKN